MRGAHAAIRQSQRRQVAGLDQVGDLGLVADAGKERILSLRQPDAIAAKRRCG
jgi:hypothetical protein